jgi:diadenosine tetraphosphate (Ap4A) HIT family hydrolase
VAIEPPRKGEDSADCVACSAPDDAYIWVSERWRVRAMDRPTGLPMVLILESRSHLDLGDLPNLLAAELGVMTVRLERAVRSLDGVARVHVNRWGDGSAHLHMWFLARPYGRLQLRGTFLSLWDDILPPISEAQWRENLALVAAWLAEFGGRPLAEPPRIQWQAPSNLTQQASAAEAATREAALAGPPDGASVALAEAPSSADAPSAADAPSSAGAGSSAEGRAAADAPSSAGAGSDADAASRATGRAAADAASRATGRAAADAPSRATGRAAADAPSRAEGRDDAEARADAAREADPPPAPGVRAAVK